MKTLLIYSAAALCEIAGCFAFWAAFRQGRPKLLLLAGLCSLTLFAWLLTLADSDYAGRAYAAYGGIYIAASLFWLWTVEGARPDRWDLIGSSIAVAGAAVVLFGPRS